MPTFKNSILGPDGHNGERQSATVLQGFHKICYSGEAYIMNRKAGP